MQRHGYTVRAATRRPLSFPAAVEIAAIPDLNNTVDWQPILLDVDAIVHLAGLAHGYVANDDYSELDQVNRIATEQLASAAKEAGVGRLIFISSVRAQIGASSPRVISEQDEPHPTNCYGRSKLAAEQAIRAAGVPFIIFRPVVIYGPNPKGNMRTLVRLAMLPLPLPIASFTSPRSVLGIDNLTSAIVFALENPAAVGETYLLADSKPMTVGQILTILRDKYGRSWANLYVPQFIVKLMLALGGRSDLWARFTGNLVVDASKFEALGVARGQGYRGRPARHDPAARGKQSR